MCVCVYGCVCVVLVVNRVYRARLACAWHWFFSHNRNVISHVFNVLCCAVANFRTVTCIWTGIMSYHASTPIRYVATASHHLSTRLTTIITTTFCRGTTTSVTRRRHAACTAFARTVNGAFDKPSGSCSGANVFTLLIVYLCCPRYECSAAVWLLLVT